MSEQVPLRPATADEIAQSLAHALCFDGRKRILRADGLMARITAEHLVQHLLRCGYILMKQPDRMAPTTTSHIKPDQGS